MGGSKFRYYIGNELSTWIDRHCRKCGRFLSLQQDKYCKDCALVIYKKQQDDYKREIEHSVNHYFFNFLINQMNLTIPRWLRNSLSM